MLLGSMNKNEPISITNKKLLAKSKEGLVFFLSANSRHLALKKIME